MYYYYSIATSVIQVFCSRKYSNLPLNIFFFRNSSPPHFLISRNFQFSGATHYKVPENTTPNGRLVEISSRDLRRHLKGNYCISRLT